MGIGYEHGRIWYGERDATCPFKRGRYSEKGAVALPG